MKTAAWLWARLKSFGLFWKDFLIGDNPEFLVGTIIILGLAFITRTSTLMASITLPGAAILLLGLGIRSGSKG